MTMGHSCEDAIRQLYEYIDGALTIERRTVITAHLQACSHCVAAKKIRSPSLSVRSLNSVSDT